MILQKENLKKLNIILCYVQDDLCIKNNLNFCVLFPGFVLRAVALTPRSSRCRATRPS